MAESRSQEQQPHLEKGNVVLSLLETSFRSSQKYFGWTLRRLAVHLSGLDSECCELLVSMGPHGDN